MYMWEEKLRENKIVLSFRLKADREREGERERERERVVLSSVFWELFSCREYENTVLRFRISSEVALDITRPSTAQTK